mgnify:CR=1 FL=1
MRTRASILALALAPVLPAQVDVKPHLDTEGKAILAIQSGIAVADYWSTKRGLRYGGRETNPLLATSDGRLSVPKYVAFNAATIGGTYAYERYLKHSLPPWARNTMRGVIYAGGIYWRGYVVGRNLIRANSLINSQR